MTDDTNIIIAQMELLQSRIEAYTNRLWQLPFSYLGVFAISVGLADENTAISLSSLFVLLGLLGCIVTFCMYGASEGYIRAAENLQKIESKAGFLSITKTKRIQTLPYFIIVIATIIAAFYLSFSTSIAV